MSNYSAAEILEFSAVLPVETVQPPYHPFRRDIEADLLPYAAAHGIGVLAYEPLAHGLLGGAIAETTTFDADDWRSHSRAFTGEGFARNLEVVAALRRFAADRGATISQLAVAWVLAHPAVQVAIVGARTPALAESVGALDLTLSHGDLAEIDHIMAAAVPVGGPTRKACDVTSQLAARPFGTKSHPGRGQRTATTWSRFSGPGGWAARWPPTWPGPASRCGPGTGPLAAPPPWSRTARPWRPARPKPSRAPGSSSPCWPTGPPPTRCGAGRTGWPPRAPA